MSTNSEDSSTEKSFDLIRDYIETRASILKLQFIKGTARMTGYFVWLVITLVLVTMLLVFLGIVSGFWFSSLTGSHTTGFAISAGIILFLIIILTLMRGIFVNPFIRAFIKRTTTEDEKGKE